MHQNMYKVRSRCTLENIVQFYLYREQYVRVREQYVRVIRNYEQYVYINVHM